MSTSARQLCAAGLKRGAVLGVALLLVAGAAQLPTGVRVREAGQTVVPHTLRELTHLLHKGRIPKLFMFAAWGQIAARLLRGAERRVVLLLVADTSEPPARIRVGKAGYAVGPHALRILERLLLASGRRRLVARRRAASCQQDEGSEQCRGGGNQGHELSSRECAVPAWKEAGSELGRTMNGEPLPRSLRAQRGGARSAAARPLGRRGGCRGPRIRGARGGREREDDAEDGASPRPRAVAD